MSIAYLAHESNDLRALLDQRQQTDQRLFELRTAGDAALARAPRPIVEQWTALGNDLDQLSRLRSLVDSRSTDSDRVYDFYNDLLDAATRLFDTQARVVPDVTATQGGIAATEVFRASDLMSRAGSTIDGAFASDGLSRQEHLEFVRMVGAYHSTMDTVAPHLQPGVRERYERLVASDAWEELVAAENAIIASGSWRTGPPSSLSVDGARWARLSQHVADELINLTIAQADEVSAQTLRTGTNQLLTAALGSLLALTIAVGAILWAIRQSQVLVDRALSVRLARLGSAAAALVDQRLPAMMERLRRHERVDVAVELPVQDYGGDEIGEVAAVINRSLQAAAGAAVDEAKTRAAGIAMLSGVARRPQRPLQRGLKVIEDLQNRIGDEKVLTDLFDINHQLTQIRRFLENLVILAGGQIGRRFHNPVPVRRVLLAAFSETQHYQRITLRSAPEVAITGQAVAATVHLLAELLDNALVFSPPGTTVWVTCHEVQSGVAVEIEDAGVGMKPEVLDAANRLLATAPTPDVTAMRDGAQVGLHVVAELAKREGIMVSLRTSAYGGLLAIALLPDRLIAADLPEEKELAETAARITASTAPVAASSPNGAGRHDQRPAAPPPAAAVTAASGRAPLARRTGTGGEGGAPGAGAVTKSRPSSGDAGHAQRPGGAAKPTAGGSPSPATARPPLPTREPQQHLAPQLRDDTGPGAGLRGVAERSPEEARTQFARYQKAWAAGQAAGRDETAIRDDQGGIRDQLDIKE